MDGGKGLLGHGREFGVWWARLSVVMGENGAILDCHLGRCVDYMYIR